MSWILLLIELIPTIIKLVNLIMDLIKKLPLNERKAYRQRLFKTARAHVRKRAGRQPVFELALSQESAERDLEALLAELEAKVGPA